MKNLEYFDYNEDKLRQTLVFELFYILIRNLVKQINEISTERFEDLPDDMKKFFVTQLTHINAFTEMAKPFVYEWPDKSEQDAYNAWIGSSLRELMLRSDVNSDIVDESEGTN